MKKRSEARTAQGRGAAIRHRSMHSLILQYLANSSREWDPGEGGSAGPCYQEAHSGRRVGETTQTDAHKNHAEVSSHVHTSWLRLLHFPF